MRTADLLRHVGRGALDLAFPPVCAGCETAGAFLCERCLADLPPAAPPRCPHCWDIAPASMPCARCLAEPPAFDALRSPYAFAGPAREAVHRLKYGGLAAAGPAMAELMAQAWPGWDLPADIVVPAPLHPRRRRLRGYNQAAELARPLARSLGLPYAEDALRRVRGTPPLAAGRGREERRRALEGAFAPGAAASAVHRKRVLLVDDVATTGVTLSWAAEALRVAGATAVVAAVFARDGSPLPSPAVP